MDGLKNELAQGNADVDRLRDDRTAYSIRLQDQGDSKPTPQIIQVQVEAAAVLPAPSRPSPKEHGEGNKGKCKGKRSRSSTPVGKRNSKGDGKRRSTYPRGQGQDRMSFSLERRVQEREGLRVQPSSIDQKADHRVAMGRGNGQPQSTDWVCHAWKKDGKCKYGEKCRFRHHDPAAPAAKEKAKPKKAAPAILARHDGESDSEAETPVKPSINQKNKTQKDGIRSKKRVRFSDNIEVARFTSQCSLGDNAPKSQTQSREESAGP